MNSVRCSKAKLQFYFKVLQNFTAESKTLRTTRLFAQRFKFALGRVNFFSLILLLRSAFSISLHPHRYSVLPHHLLPLIELATNYGTTVSGSQQTFTATAVGAVLTAVEE
jgi:hypothetical protein